MDYYMDLEQTNKLLSDIRDRIDFLSVTQLTHTVVSILSKDKDIDFYDNSVEPEEQTKIINAVQTVLFVLRDVQNEKEEKEL